MAAAVVIEGLFGPLISICLFDSLSVGPFGLKVLLHCRERCSDFSPHKKFCWTDPGGGTRS